MPFSISYRSPGKELKIRAHVAPTQEIADAVVAYVEREYEESPESITAMPVVHIDPGGAARMNPRECSYEAPSGTTYLMDYYHVQDVLHQLRDAPLMTYGDSEEVCRVGCHFVSIVLASDVEGFKNWLASLPKWTIEREKDPTPFAEMPSTGLFLDPSVRLINDWSL